MSPFLILHNDLGKNNGRSNMTYGRWHCGKTLALNQTHSGMLQLKCLGDRGGSRNLGKGGSAQYIHNWGRVRGGVPPPVTA